MSKNYVHGGGAAGLEVLKALGIAPDHVKGVTIRVFCDEAVTATVERFVTEDELISINGILERERLNPTPREPDSIRVKADTTAVGATNKTYVR